MRPAYSLSFPLNRQSNRWQSLIGYSSHFDLYDDDGELRSTSSRFQISEELCLHSILVLLHWYIYSSIFERSTCTSKRSTKYFIWYTVNLILAILTQWFGTIEMNISWLYLFLTFGTESAELFHYVFHSLCNPHCCDTTLITPNSCPSDECFPCKFRYLILTYIQSLWRTLGPQQLSHQ